jgi:hypothetical protein
MENELPLKSPGFYFNIHPPFLLGWWPGVERLAKVSRENL